MLRISSSFAPGYDGTLDRYAFMLDELRRADFRRLRTFAADGRAQFSSWLAVVARRLCLDHHRRERGRSVRREPAGRPNKVARVARRELERLDGGFHDVALVPAQQLDPTETLDRRDRCAAVRRVVNRLSADDRLLLRLRFGQELTAREIAAVLGLTSPLHVYRRLDIIYRMVRSGLRTARE
jgi:RNA polymerase sigma factor (sigma-70 family)